EHRAMKQTAECKEALADLAFWDAIFQPIGCVVVGWTYRNHCQIRLPSKRYLSIGSRELELLKCARPVTQNRSQ
ncbi:MAG TPA: hypothetical protein VJ063_12015, partial [Verrucomicrobiae bacterium]|nr:hypothetical protein [Verrucomicrobiae bacterium]